MSSGIEFALPAADRELAERVRAYVEEVAIPAEQEVGSLTDLAVPGAVIDRLRSEARARGIYGPSIPAEFGGLGLGALPLCLVAEACGVSTLASVGLNAMAPDEGNIHVLLRAADPDQRELWLRPLAEGRVRSCFLMTEPDVASSDPLNLRTEARRDREEWVLDGRKWLASGAEGAAFALVVARTGVAADRGHAYSMFVVPMPYDGLEIVRDPDLLGPHFPGGHPEVELNSVRVPAANLLGAVGEGFAITQDRLGIGRLGHAMRWIGIGQAATDLAAARMLRRESFGRGFDEHGVLGEFLANSAIELHASRLMVLHAAWKLDTGADARQEISMLKTFVGEAFGRIVDRAVQVFGGAGVSRDHPLAQWYADARAARIYDGPSEVHRASIARHLLKLAERGESTAAACGVSWR